MALQIGHRKSIDLDFFGNMGVSLEEIAIELSEFAKATLTFLFPPSWSTRLRIPFHTAFRQVGARDYGLEALLSGGIVLQGRF